MQYRHGDLLLEHVEVLPLNCHPVPGTVLLEGENTGHAHRIEAPATILRASQATSS